MDTLLAMGLEDVEDASNHVEAATPNQLEAVGGDDMHIDSEEEEPTKVFTDEDDGKTGGS